MARIKEAVKIVGFKAADATRATEIMESLGGATDNKEKSNLHVQLKQIYKENWEHLKTFNEGLLPVSVKPPKTRRNKGVGKGAGIA